MQREKKANNVLVLGIQTLVLYTNISEVKARARSRAAPVINHCGKKVVIGKMRNIHIF